MKFAAIALAGALAFAGSAEAVSFTGSASFSQGLNFTNPGFQVRAVNLPNFGPQGFVSAALDFDLENIGDSSSFDLFVIRTLQSAIDGNDGIASPFALTFSFGQGSTTVTGTTFAQTVDGITQGFITFDNDGFINLGNATALVVSLADRTYNAGTQGFFTPGKDNGALVDVEFSLAAVPLPAALPLFLSALGLMGFLGRRRQAAIAA